MKLRSNKRLLGLLLAPFALFAGCVGLTPEEQAEYRELQEEVRRIQNEELAPRQEQLRDVVEGRLVIDSAQLQAQVNQVRNERIEPLNKKLAALKSGEQTFAAPGTRIELEELNERLADLGLLHAGIEIQIDEHRGQLLAAKEAAAAELEAQIDELQLELDDAADEDAAEAIEAQIDELLDEIDSRHNALIEQFEVLIHGLELSLHDISEEKSDVIRQIHELELASHEELGQSIDELEGLIEEIIATELRPLIEQLNAATNGDGGDSSTASREFLIAEIEEWLGRLTNIRARISELTAKSLQSLLGGLDLTNLAIGGA